MNYLRNLLILSILIFVTPFCVRAQTPTVIDTAKVPAITVAPGVTLKELTGRFAHGSAKSDQCSVAFFHLEPGKSSDWSFTVVAEESFFILKGTGDVWTGDVKQKVGPGCFILVPPKMVRSVRADRGEALEFYAVTAPAWSPDDDKTGKAPASFSK